MSLPKTRPLSLHIATLLLVGLLPSSGVAQDRVKLFDGKSLDGWEGDPKHWRVEGGTIIGEIPAGETLRKNTWLVWRGGTLRDFDLRLQVKLTGAAAANSGIQFRCQVENVDHVSGYQADLDQGATWLGRIYDEHGRALLVERGTRVEIEPDGARKTQTLAPAAQYGVLFREDDWNDYRIVGIGDRVSVFVNGTLFSDLRDRQLGESDLSGSLALQLHSGPQTRVAFRDMTLEVLEPNDSRLGSFEIEVPNAESESDIGHAPRASDGTELDLGFESGNLAGWTATGNAFKDQPVNRDGIANRWRGQSSNKQGDYFIGGFEIVQDGGTGTLKSDPFNVSHPFASFLIGGGDADSTRVEIVKVDTQGAPITVIHKATGNRREQMRRVVVDLREHQGSEISIALIDNNSGAWGHLNFDDFRFHSELPKSIAATPMWRSTANPLLHHLVPNKVDSKVSGDTGSATLSQMHVPEGFSVDLIAAEPDLHQPMAFTFDARGRLWVVEGNSYPQKRPRGEGLDRILILTDTDGDGTFENRKIFAEGLNLVSGMEVGHGGVWIGAAPELLFIPDLDGDDVPDSEPQVLLDGFGYADTHETLNSFLWGPDGWLYGNQGVFNQSRIGKPGASDQARIDLSAGVWRYHPSDHVFEVFAHGGSNQWGLDYDLHGQLFMTHCRSHWGRGPTTHVIQGAHYWNQINSGYADFISPTGSIDQPQMRNYMLASARYGHGEGGAGKSGSRTVYGGHSHVGTMIYLGDNWPSVYRNHLFTHNLHGHQINQQVNRRSAGGYRTHHAGSDPFFCADRQYVGVDLKVGPDGAVYISDWYDPRHCHNPNVEQWDRATGRIYRMSYDENYRQARVDYSRATDDELVEAQLHKNAWHGRMARLVMHERAIAGRFSAKSVKRLHAIALEHTDTDRRLSALWSLAQVKGLDHELASQLLQDPNEYIRAWAVQLSVEHFPSGQINEELHALSVSETSLLVRRYLASAIQRLPAVTGWSIAAQQAAREDTSTDRELTLLLWYGIAEHWPDDLERTLALADSTKVPRLADYILWYCAKHSDEGRDAVAAKLLRSGGGQKVHYLGLLDLAVRGMRQIPPPAGWSGLSQELYESSDPQVRRTAESLGTVFADQALFARMRQVLLDANSSDAAKRGALRNLETDPSPQNVEVYLPLLDQPELIAATLPMLVRYSDRSVADEILGRLRGWTAENSQAAMEVLVSRPTWANQVLDAIQDGQLPIEMLTAYDARQIDSLGDKELSARLLEQWGQIGRSSESRRAEIKKLVAAFERAPLWAYDAGAGAGHFKKLCASCHQPSEEQNNLAPRLAGSGSKGIEYIVENVLDPNAVIGRDFQARNVLTDEGRVVTGLVAQETESAVTIRTATNRVTIDRDEIEEIRISENSFMPEGLLVPLNDREKLELLKYLMTL